MDNNQLVDQYFRKDRLPHIWCPGCGHGVIMHSIVKAIAELGWDKNDVVVVSGIGCSSRAPGYMDFNTLHTTHGRALAFATGVKLAKPHLKVIVISGDGDASAIGGNHLIHASRRNIDITTIVFNNNTYGMTGGQYSPTTPTNEFGTTAPHGNIDAPFDIANLAGAAGATYTARTTAFHMNQMTTIIKNALEHKGFSLVEAISVCPTYYGRKNKKGDAPQMMKWLKDTFIDIKVADKLPEEKRVGKLLMGEFKNVQKPEYTEEYHKIVDRLSGVK
ncbi:MULTISPECIES: thiamine pyrophosphate-dependent enzyme [unclassified Fusibacter]|uniref:thiamine pyrophosphate-dependent enzyme n=1 Tax=unclassified Fusibacter TaxID=2624464 RepID=UPI0010108F87|nr:MULTISPECIES: thiamine pyrophosphate-dependent enzyme [unclassified Fusibacter]MCK8058820.1 thiamine pyrophosphate-dependent enzyme [Fusibacter sp. A2]NPE21894.1 2-oxoacid:ferredoxin oxidoreductase subunit beta [Fusibacter sp. A1]RXV61465.1 2-oxoacid:ferredoxin oxidoreductase subunit beta [Fusibacter sp. A1]